MLYQYQCSICEHEFEEFRRFADRNNAIHCGEKAIKLIPTGVQIADDGMWDFVCEYFGKTPTRVTSRQHYRQLCKKHGLVDVTLKETMSVKPDHKHLDARLDKLNDRILKRCAKDGLIEHVDPLIRKVSKPIKKEE